MQQTTYVIIKNIMNKIKLTKMQGLGNDFVILDYTEFEKTGMSMTSMSDFAVKVCDRNFGVGADGMIIPNLTPKTGDIGWYFYNSDGTTAQMCGNGIRCFAKYARDKKLVNSNKFDVETLAGIITPEILEDGTVKVNMSKPILDMEKIPLRCEGFGALPPHQRDSAEQKLTKCQILGEVVGVGGSCLNFPLTVNDREFKLNAVSMGNPHCIIFVEGDEDLLELAKTYGPKIENHELFPEKTNVEFIKIKSRNEMDLRVFERGCGITLACGTGACASVVAGILNNLTDGKVKVNLLGGALTIEWQGSTTNQDCDVYMSGPAEYSFFAEYLV